MFPPPLASFNHGHPSPFCLSPWWTGTSHLPSPPSPPTEASIHRQQNSQILHHFRFKFASFDRQEDKRSQGGFSRDEPLNFHNWNDHGYASAAQRSTHPTWSAGLHPRILMTGLIRAQGSACGHRYLKLQGNELSLPDREKPGTSSGWYLSLTEWYSVNRPNKEILQALNGFIVQHFKLGSGAHRTAFNGSFFSVRQGSPSVFQGRDRPPQSRAHPAPGSVLTLMPTIDCNRVPLRSACV